MADRQKIDEPGGYGGGWYWWPSHCSRCGWHYLGGGTWWRWLRFRLHHCTCTALYPTPAFEHGFVHPADGETCARWHGHRGVHWTRCVGVHGISYSWPNPAGDSD